MAVCRLSWSRSLPARCILFQVAQCQTTMLHCSVSRIVARQACLHVPKNLPGGNVMLLFSHMLHAHVLNLNRTATCLALVEDLTTSAAFHRQCSQQIWRVASCTSCHGSAWKQLLQEGDGSFQGSYLVRERFVRGILAQHAGISA